MLGHVVQRQLGPERHHRGAGRVCFLGVPLEEEAEEEEADWPRIVHVAQIGDGSEGSVWKLGRAIILKDDLGG